MVTTYRGRDAECFLNLMMQHPKVTKIYFALSFIILIILGVWSMKDTL